MAGGRSRTVQLHVPDAVRNGALPLVLALHGNGDTAANFMATSGLGGRADVIVAAPQGVPRDVSIGNQTVPNVAWDAYNTGASNIDVALLDALQAELVRSGSVQQRQVVAFGYSQGGYLAYRYAMEASERLACAAVVAAANPGGSPKPFARKVAFSLQIGSADSAVGNARQSRDALMRDGHPVQFNEIAGAGHTPFPGPKDAPLVYCLGQTLP
jgi:poly(3-hydroxybutyrate) depolymerase